MNVKSLFVAGFLGLMASPLAGQNSAELYQELCDDGDMLGCSLLGLMYSEGQGVPQDLARAASLFQQACNTNLVEGCAHLGVMYANGIGVAQDIPRAVSLSRQACDGGDQQGCANFEVLAELMRAAVLLQLPVEDRTLAVGSVASGTLSDADPLDPEGSNLQAWSLDLRAGQQVTADLRSTDFDAYLLVTGPGLASILTDDDGGGGCDARVTFTASEDGEYRAIVSTAVAGNTGDFTLRATTTPSASALTPCSSALSPSAVTRPARPRLLAGTTAGADVATRGNSTLIVRNELVEFSGQTALEAIRLLHSGWLRATRGGNLSVGGDARAFARLVIDGIPQGPQGDLEDLDTISADAIESMSRLTATDASIKYGTGFPGGAIEVWFRRPG